MKKILFVILCLITSYCKSEINLYNFPYGIETENCIQNSIGIEFEKPKTIWSYLFIDRELRFKLEFNPEWLLGTNFINVVVPINYWCFKIYINF